MAFKLFSTDDGHVPAAEYLPCSAITPKAGMALYESSGNLAVASGAHYAKYISLAEAASAVTAGDLIPVMRIHPNMIFETTSDGAGTATVGALYDVADGGLQVDIDASTYDGFELTWAESSTAAAGTKLRGRFVKYA